MNMWDTLVATVCSLMLGLIVYKVILRDVIFRPRGKK